MNYSMEELLRVVAMLAEKYTSKESSSIPYTKAQQLMGAVLYCIDQYEQGDAEGTGVIGAAGRPDAAAAYQAGYQLVLDKMKAAQNRYSRVVMDFKSYGSRAYEETFVDGMKAFFLYYDAKFQPQDHLLTLDYPLLDSGMERAGIDRIDHYIRCVELEQGFLQQLPEEYIYYVLCALYQDYDELLINVCGGVYRNLIGCMMAGKRVDSRPYTEAAIERLTAFIRDRDRSELEYRIGKQIDFLAQQQFAGGVALGDYLKCDVKDFCAELLNGAEYHCLEQVLAI